MKIYISSLREVIKNLDYIKKNNINLISIRDTNAEEAYKPIDDANLKNILVVNFDDILVPFPDRDEKAPEESDIVRILEWAKQKMQENNNDFIVHCTAGISRSSAVAILVQYLQDPEKALKVINPMLHSPNMKVLELDEKILNTKNIKEPVKKIEKEYNERWMNRDTSKDPKNIF
jgi:predicted protein tyrosine phosphatase